MTSQLLLTLGLFNESSCANKQLFALLGGGASGGLISLSLNLSRNAKVAGRLIILEVLKSVHRIIAIDDVIVWFSNMSYKL